MDNKKIGDMFFEMVKNFIILNDFENKFLILRFTDDKNNKWSCFYRCNLLQIFLNGDVIITFPLKNDHDGIIGCYNKPDDSIDAKEIKNQLLLNLKNCFPYFSVEFISMFSGIPINEHIFS